MFFVFDNYISVWLVGFEVAHGRYDTLIILYKEITDIRDNFNSYSNIDATGCELVKV